MEEFKCYCRVELQGRIGSVMITELPLGNKVARFTLSTTYVYTDGDGSLLIETTWHTIVAYSRFKDVDLSVLKKGAGVHVVGRIRKQRYTTQSGEERCSDEIFASEVSGVQEAVGVTI